MSYTINNGRLGNQIIRNLAVNCIAEKHNLYVDYVNNDKILELGIELYCGFNKYNNTQILTDDNYFNILNADKIDYNIDSNSNYFQTKDITNYIFNYLHSDIIRTKIINLITIKIK